MQPAYVDSTGLVWGDYMPNVNLIRDAQGVTVTDGQGICEKIKIGNSTGRLPTIAEFYRLRESMSTAAGDPMPELDEKAWVSRSYNLSYDLSKPALPHLFGTFLSSTQFTPQTGQILTSTAVFYPDNNYNYNDGTHKLESGELGFLDEIHLNHSYGAYNQALVRCVIEKSALK